MDFSCNGFLLNYNDGFMTEDLDLNLSKMHNEYFHETLLISYFLNYTNIKILRNNLEWHIEIILN